MSVAQQSVSAGDTGTQRLVAAFGDAFHRRKVSRQAIRLFTSQLSLLLDTGTTLADAINSLREQTAGTPMGEVLANVHERVTGGATLSSALGDHPDVFDVTYRATARSGESSGKLSIVFERLDQFLEQRAHLEAEVRSALVYPAILSVIAVSAVIFLVTFVLPRFTSIFNQAGVILPLPTRLLMKTANIALKYWYIHITFVVGAVVGGKLYLVTESGKRMLDRIVLRLPVISPVVHLINSTTILRTLGMLLGSGVPLTDAVQVATDGIRSYTYRRFLEETFRNIINGEQLSKSFLESPLISLSIKQMVVTGERTGELSRVMLKVAEYYEKEVERSLSRATRVVEPAIIVFMAVVVGFIAISVLLPLFKMSSLARAR